MKITCLLFGLAAFVAHPFPVMAQEEGARIQVLERKLQERDKVILELLERVKALERRVGVEHVTVDTGETDVDGPREDTKASSAGVVVAREEDAERALERALTRSGALLLARGVLEIEPGLRYARSENVTPVLLSSGGLTYAAKSELNANTVTADLALRLGLPLDSQVEFGLPYRWRELKSVDSINFAPTDASHQSGGAFGDVRLGLAKTLLREGVWRPDFVGRITWDTDSGDLQENGVSLGGGYNELRGELTAIKRQDPIVFVGGLSYEYSFEENQIRPGPTVAANLGSYIALNPETSLSFVFSGAYQDKTELFGSDIVGSDRTLATFTVGASTLLARGTLLNLSLGIGLTDDADDFVIAVSLPIRFDDRIY